MKCLVTTFIALLFISPSSLAQPHYFNQHDEDISYPSKLYIQPRIGFSWQSTLFKPVFDFSAIRELSFLSYPIEYEKGTQGFGLDLGAAFLIDINKSNRFGFQPNVRYRYDYYYGVPHFEPYDKEIKASIFDISIRFLFSHVMANNGEWLILVGYTANQVGKKQSFDLSKTVLRIANVDVNFQYHSFYFGFEYDFYKISPSCFLSGNIAANYIPYGHPAYPWRDFMDLGFGISIKYKPQSLIFAFKH